MPSPAYDLADLVAACGGGGAIVAISKGAMKTAQSDFGLRKQSEVRAFIHNDGIESPRYVNTEPWENNPDPNTVIYADAYTFRSGGKSGYLSFFWNVNWIIKSFKADQGAGLVYLPFANLDKLLKGAPDGDK